MSGGYAAPNRIKSTMSSRIISHLETGYVVSGKNYSTGLRERRFLDVPGCNRSRGWSGCGLKEEGDQLKIPYSLKLGLEAKKEDVTKKEVVADEQAGDEKDSSQVDSKEGSMVWQWGHPEIFWRELFHAFGTPPGLRIVSTTASSAAMVAAARDGYLCHGYVRTQTCKQILMEDSCLKISLCMIHGSQEFGRMRVLTREESLGGAGDNAPAPSASETPRTAGAQTDGEEGDGRDGAESFVNVDD